MKTKKVKRPKLVYGNYTCVREWVQRGAASKDPDTDPDLLVKSSETGGNTFTTWDRSSGGSSWKYTSMYPTYDTVRKIESRGRRLYTYGSFLLAKLIGTGDTAFWLINSRDSDSMTSRVRSDLFQVLTKDFTPRAALETRTDQFAFVPEHLLDVTAEQIKDRWAEYVQHYRYRIENIGTGFSYWVTGHADLALRTTATEYATLGRYVGIHNCGEYHMAHDIMRAKEKLNAAAVLRKLKEK